MSGKPWQSGRAARSCPTTDKTVSRVSVVHGERFAMKVAEVTRTTPDPSGGKILKDANGNPTGLFNERAQSLVSAAYARDRATRTPAKVEADLREVIELASREAPSKGLTGMHDAGSPPSTIDLMKKLVDERKPPAFPVNALGRPAHMTAIAAGRAWV